MKSDREYLLRIRVSKDEMARLTEDTRRARPNEKSPKVAHYIRDVLAVPPTVPAPEFPDVTEFPERPIRVRLRLNYAEDHLLNRLADDAGTDTERYVRWRLLGVVI